MKISLLLIGKTSEKFLQEGIDVYVKRLSKYVGFQIVERVLPVKFQKLPPLALKQKEAEAIIQVFKSFDYIVLLDERGSEFSSLDFAGFIARKHNMSIKNLLFVIGGAWGFHESVYNLANERISLSKMTFSHQMVRLFFVEQLYRAYTIMHNEPYHNQ